MPRGAICTSLSPHATFLVLFFLLQNAFYELNSSLSLQSPLPVLFLEVWHYVLVGFVVYEALKVRECDTRDPLLRWP